MWQPTHGKSRGAYLVAGGVSLYIKQVMSADGLPAGPWKLYVDGRLEGTADGELVAKAAAECAARMVEAGAPAMAAPTDEADRAA